MYSCHYSPTLDWARAPLSPRFVDLITGEPGHFDTRAAALWNDHALHIKMWAEDPYPEARYTERDSIIFLESDLEVFIDGGDTYYEFEVNALGTIYEVFFIWQDAWPKFASAFPPPTLSFGGNFDRAGEHFWRGTHPRGLRWAFPDWDFPGLAAKVEVDGRLNDRSHVSRGWSVEVSFPWAGMTHLANGRAIPPAEGDTWRLMFARYQKMEIGGRELQPHPAWAWHPIGHQDNHVPEKWTPIQFTHREL